MRICFDVETNAIEKPSVVWCAVAEDIDSGTRYHYTAENMHDFAELIGEADEIIGHNIIAYDLPVINSLLGIVVHPSRVTDTLVLGHLLHYSVPDGHSLEAWGKRLKLGKVGKDVDFTKYSAEILARCKQDVKINVKLYKYLEGKLLQHGWREAIDLEHKMAWVCEDMRRTGFSFDFDTAKALHEEISTKVDALDIDLRTAFPPKPKVLRTITPRLTKHGTISRSNLPRDWVDLTHLTPGEPVDVVTLVPFNPNSPKQIVERLNEAGWKPTEKTKGHHYAERGSKEFAKHNGGHGKAKYRKVDKEEAAKTLAQMKVYGWKVNEANLATLPDDAPVAARSLVERIMLGSRLRTLEEWFKAYDMDDGKVHGRFNSIGTWTHRMSHRAPNMGNIAAAKTIKYAGDKLASMAIDLGTRMRDLWRVSNDDYWLVGTDASGIQLRIFAHYVNDAALTEAVIGADPHAYHADLLGISRSDAKTFIYAFLLGAGNARIGDIVGGDRIRGAEIKQQFIEAYPGLQQLRDTTIKSDAARRYFVGLDGRMVFCDNAHLVLAGYLQNGEATVMKHANIGWRDELDRQGIEYKQVNFVHDEWQTEVRGASTLAERVGQAQVDSIRRVGETFGLRCPLDGKYKIGKTWLDTH